MVATLWGSFRECEMPLLASELKRERREEAHREVIDSQGNMDGSERLAIP
jgi:hypothetical protein